MKRLDQILVEQKLAPSRTQAQKMISTGRVCVVQGGVASVQTKVSLKLPDDVLLEVREGEEQRFVSRAGLKLEGVLTRLDIQVDGLCALDVGQSTGGFTDCLLQHGIEKVVGVDVGHDQLVAKLRDDARVECMEGINARTLETKLFAAQGLPVSYALIVMDVSFISQTLILPRLALLAEEGGLLISLVKPQFEVGPEGIGKGGIVKDDSWYPKVQKGITECLQRHHFDVIDYSESVITGGDGNREFIAVARFSPQGS